MYSIEIKNLEDVLRILKLNPVDFVDINFKKNAFIVNNSSEIFGAVALKCDKLNTSGTQNSMDSELQDDDSELIIRVPRMTLMALLTVGHLNFDIQGEITIMSVYNCDNKRTASVRFKTQYANNLRYKDKLELMSMRHKIVNISEVQELVALAKDFKSVVSVNNNVIGIRAGARIRIYKETKIKERFSIGLDVLKSVLSLSNEVFLANKYLGTIRGNVAILATQSIGFETDEYFILKDYGSGLILDVDIGNFVDNYRKISYTGDNVILDTDTGEFILKSENQDINLDAEITNKRRAPRYNEVSVIVPKIIVQSVLLRMHGKITLKCKQTCNIIESNDLTVIY